MKGIMNTIKTSASTFDIGRNGFLGFEQPISKSRSMESLISVSAYGCDEACYDSSNNLNHSINCKHHLLNKRAASPSPRSSRAKFIAEIDEIRINPIVSKKGYLNFLDDKSNSWIKKFVTIRRPFVFIYKNDRDPLERSIINLSTAQIVYSEEQIEMFKNQNTISVTNNHRGFLMQTLTEKEIFDWLYALNPLLAGEIRSKLSRKRPENLAN
jgi:hypothetical protein